jgi:hypothetical protein
MERTSGPEFKFFHVGCLEKLGFLFKYKAGGNFNRRNTLSILRIKFYAQRSNWIKRQFFEVPCSFRGHDEKSRGFFLRALYRLY